MKQVKVIMLIVFFCTCLKVSSQTQAMWWGGITVDSIVHKSDLIFEGRILTDSVFVLNPPGNLQTVHRVLVLKKFKGVFKSDTIKVVTYGGKLLRNNEWDGTPGAYAFKGDEAVFLVQNSLQVYLGGTDPNTYYPIYGPGVGFVTICNKEDIVKEVYAPIETAIGQKYIDLHPNTCKGQQKR